jgi:hypothetical protein
LELLHFHLRACSAVEHKEFGCWVAGVFATYPQYAKLVVVIGRFGHGVVFVNGGVDEVCALQETAADEK